MLSVVLFPEELLRNSGGDQVVVGTFHQPWIKKFSFFAIDTCPS
jgi:hypothetical protein